MLLTTSVYCTSCWALLCSLKVCCTCTRSHRVKIPIAFLFPHPQWYVPHLSVLLSHFLGGWRCLVRASCATRLCHYSNGCYFLSNEANSIVWRSFVMGTSSRPDGLFLVSDAPSVLSALFLKGLCDLRFCRSSHVNETTPEKCRAEFILSKLSRG